MTEANREGSPLPQKFRAWLTGAVDAGASDLHLIAGYPPVRRMHGDLIELPEPPLAGDEVRELLTSLCPPETIARLEAQKNVDFSFGVVLGGRVCRFRANVFQSTRQLGACLRVVPMAIPELEWAQFPPTLAQRLAFLRDGLVIVTGATGSGKTTTLAMIVNLINQAGGYRIITVEEPVEYLFPRMANSVVTQREVGRRCADVCRRPQVRSAARPRRDPGRRNPRPGDGPDGAERRRRRATWCSRTLHTRDAKGAITRYADLFPQDVQKDVRSQLAMSLRAIVSQRLLARRASGERNGTWRWKCCGTPTRSPAPSALARWRASTTTSSPAARTGMVSFDESVRQLFAAGKITREVAEKNVTTVSVLDR